jgi:1,4-dihydroxy-2-naphthoate octaprenyltransferase
MDNIMQRRIVAILGMLIALGGLTALIWGIMKRDTIIQLIGFFSILIAYVFTVIIKKLKEKEKKDKQASELK